MGGVVEAIGGDPYYGQPRSEDNPNVQYHRGEAGKAGFSMPPAEKSDVDAKGGGIPGF